MKADPRRPSWPPARHLWARTNPSISRRKTVPRITQISAGVHCLIANISRLLTIFNILIRQNFQQYLVKQWTLQWQSELWHNLNQSDPSKWHARLKVLIVYNFFRHPSLTMTDVLRPGFPLRLNSELFEKKDAAPPPQVCRYIYNIYVNIYNIYISGPAPGSTTTQRRGGGGVFAEVGRAQQPGHQHLPPTLPGNCCSYNDNKTERLI